jgi:nucleoside-diphosphate-sugar epimerase
MKLLITGACGFTGSTLARAFQELDPTIEICGVDNLARPGSEQNRLRLNGLGVRVVHGDVRCPSDLHALPKVQWVIDGGGVQSAMSLAQLSAWCADRFGQHHVGHDSAARPYDVPWIVLDSTKAKRQWDWQPTVPVRQILEEIAQHAEEHPEWLEISSST